MLQAGAALRADPDPARAAAGAAEAAREVLGSARIDAALVFATLPADLARCSTAAREALGAPAICAVAGHAVIGGEGELEAAGSVAVLALAGATAHGFAIAAADGVEETIGPEVESLLGRSPRETDLVLVFADPLSIDPGRLAGALRDLAPACVVGAGAALARPGAALLASDGRAFAGGVCGLALALPTPARVAVSQGCRRFGPARAITRADGHWVLEIDGKPALDVYAEAARAPLATDLRRAAERVLVALPCGVRDVADEAWVARRVSGFAPERCAFALPERARVGSALWFALRDADLARDDLRSALVRATPARAALYLGASDRGRALFRHEGLESAIVAQALAPAPFAGFFGSFELAPLGGSLAHLAHAAIVVALA